MDHHGPLFPSAGQQPAQVSDDRSNGIHTGAWHSALRHRSLSATLEVPFLLFFGFAATCPLLLVEGLNIRLTEALAAVAFVTATWRILQSGKVHPVARLYVPLLLFTLGWVIVELYFDSFIPTERAGRMLLVRWLEGFPIAYCLVMLCSDERKRFLIAIGMLAGLGIDLALLIQDDVTFALTRAPLYTAVGLANYAAGEYRAAGIFGHPNGAAIATLILVPVAIGLIRERRLSAILFLLPLAAVVEVFLLTKTRGASMVSMLLIAYSIVRTLRLRTIAIIALATALLVTTLAALQGSTAFEDEAVKVVSERFDRPTEMDENFEGRLDTMVAAIELIGEHPFGMGAAYMSEMAAKVDYEATHNAFLQLALLGGIPLTLTIAIPLVLAAAGIVRRDSSLEAWIAAYLCMAFFFETAFFLPIVPALTLWSAWPYRRRRSFARESSSPIKDTVVGSEA